MHINDACKLFQGIIDGVYTAEQLLRALDPPKEWSARDQKVLSSTDIRMAWFAENMQGKSIGVNVPKWNQPENVKRFALVPRKTKHTEPSLFDVLVGKLARKGIKINWHPRNDQSYVEHAEKINAKPEIKPAEIVSRRAEIAKENEDRKFYRSVDNRGYYKNKKRERKLMVARMFAEQPNATQKAVDRYFLMLEDERSRFPGLPTHYLPKTI